jgi:hypothetical protein
MTDAEATTEAARLNEFNALTPMQQLVLEVLGARLRLGHEVWTFTRSDALTKALRALAAVGYLGWKSGVVQGTALVWLTDAGRWLILDPQYVPPIADKGDEPQHGA